MSFSFLRIAKLRTFTIPLVLAASACSSSHSTPAGDATSDAGAPGTAGASGSGNAGMAGSGVSGASGSGGNAGSAGSAVSGTGGVAGIAGSGVSGGGIGGTPTVDTVPCQGGFPAEDVSSVTNKVSAGDSSLGSLPHFWTTFGLGRMGLYLNASQLPTAFQAQDRTSFDGKKWSDVLKSHTTDAVMNLGLTSIRAHGLFHDDIGIYSEPGGTPAYDFSRSDIIFDFLTQNHVAPIVELADMPAALASNPSQTVFDWKMIVSPPKDYSRWQALVQAFVQHSVDRYGADVVNTWYFEVWNEPECCSGKFWKGTLSDYFTLYDKSVAGVHAVLPNGRVGGPVSSQVVELTQNSMAGIQFLDHVKSTGGPLGFFSYHTWAFLDGAVNGYFTALDLLDSYNQSTVPIAVTEFGPTWQFGLMGAAMEPAWEPQETAQGAAFVAQTYSNIAQRVAEQSRRFPVTFAWWTLSDVFDEGYSDKNDYSAESNPFIAAMGLLTRESIRTPAYNAYKFLAQLGDEQLSLAVTSPGGIGGMAARNNATGGVQVLLYNGQSPGQGYQDNNYYTVAAAQDIGVTVSGLNPMLSYNVTAYRVDDTHGNAFTAWTSLGKKTMANMSTTDWQTLRTAMDSPAEPVGQALCGASLTKKFSLSSPGALLLTIEPALM